MNGAGPDAVQQQALERLQELIAALEGMEPAAAAPARELVQLVLDLHGNGLARLLQIIADAGNGRVLLERLSLDEQVKGLLMLHGLHPEDLETRVRAAVQRLHPHLAVIGVSVQAVDIVDGAARLGLRCEGNGHRPLQVETLRREIEDAVLDAAPDVAGIAIEGLPVVTPDAVRSVVWSWSRGQPQTQRKA